MNTKSHAGGVSAFEANGFSGLFSRFVSGQISETSWTRMMSILDEGETTRDERFALMNFLSDACFDLGPEAVEVPGLVDVEELVSMMRAA